MKPTLLVMAAGMGSRYGGLKQIDPVDPEGQKILDFSVYDAMRAGFGDVVFVIKDEISEAFREAVGDKISRHFPVRYAFQRLNALPEGFSVPEGRTKPWGTAQAVLAAADIISAPFAVINADDFYGRQAYEVMADFLTGLLNGEGEIPTYAMTAFTLGKTLTENGSVSRGIVELSDDGFMRSVTERTRIEKDGVAAKYTTDDGATWVPLTGKEHASMNFWGFGPSLLPELGAAFASFLSSLSGSADPIKAECQLPAVIDALVQAGKAKVKILTSEEQWYGVTYQEDKPLLTAGIERLKEQGVYPRVLWE